MQRASTKIQERRFSSGSVRNNASISHATRLRNVEAIQNKCSQKLNSDEGKGRPRTMSTQIQRILTGTANFKLRVFVTQIRFCQRWHAYHIYSCGGGLDCQPRLAHPAGPGALPLARVRLQGAQLAARCCHQVSSGDCAAGDGCLRGGDAVPCPGRVRDRQPKGAPGGRGVAAVDTQADGWCFQ